MTSISATSSTTVSNTTTSTAASNISGDYETFLKMLTTQMQNQDPLNPIESSDYAVQLATFSSVEQQVRTNELLEELTGTLGTNGLGSLADWVGKEVCVAAPSYHDGSSGIVLSLDPADNADRVELIVTNADGDVVERVDVTGQEGQVLWPQQTGDGSAQDEGVYSFRLQSWSGSDELSNEEVSVYSTVIEAQIGDTGTQLVLNGGSKVSASDVSTLRLPG